MTARVFPFTLQWRLTLLAIIIPLLWLSPACFANCKQDISALTPLQQGALAIESKRLDRFLYTTSQRYTADPAVQKLAKAISIDKNVQIQPFFDDLTGSVLVKMKDNHLEVDIPHVHQIDEFGTVRVEGSVSERIDTRFVKIMTAVTLATDAILKDHPAIRSVSFTSNVVNERLANLLLDLGFETPAFRQLLTPEEIHFILTEKKLPPALYETVDLMRAAAPNFEWARQNFPEAQAPVEEKPIYSIPFLMTVPISIAPEAIH